jgi:transitional endoplasmic reticulum ATPase
MTDPNQIALDALRQAVRLAPDNLDLVEHLCRTLIALSKADEAVDHYRTALERRPGHYGLQLGLAESYWRSDRNSHALAIIETLIHGKSPTAAAWLLHARLMQAASDTRTAISSYREAIDIDPSVSEPELESLLGIDRPSDDPPQRMTWEGIDPQAEDDIDVEIERPNVKFKDVGGMESVKEDIRIKIIYPMQHADMYAAYGKKAGGGILMYGPPGCGKTLLARATAGEVESKFMSIGINDVLDMFIGNSEKNLHQLFEQARRNTPCVLFFDEVDALGASRSDMRKTGGRHLINQFLSELDGIEAKNDGLLCLAATNAPWHLDPAFKRPGRFDRMVFVPPPDEAARVEILQIALHGKPTDNIDHKKIASKTEYFSGADIRAIVDVAIEVKLRDAVKSGRPTPLSTNDLLTALKGQSATTHEWFATARNHALYSNEGSAYDPILKFLGLKK